MSAQIYKTTYGLATTSKDGLMSSTDKDTLSKLSTIVASGTIDAGDTSITLTNSDITTSSIIDIYFEDKVLAPKTVTIATGSITITIDAQTTDTNVGITVV